MYTHKQALLGFSMETDHVQVLGSQSVTLRLRIYDNFEQQSWSIDLKGWKKIKNKRKGNEF